MQTRSVEPWRKLRPADPAGFATFGGIALTHDGLTYAYDYHQTFDHLYLVQWLR